MMSARDLRVGLVQQQCEESRERNLDRAEAGVRSAADDGARLILLQELVADPYICRTEDPALFDLAEPVPGPISERLGRLAAELGVVIATSVFERRAAGVYHNTGIVLDSDGGLAGTYRKMHIPDDPGYGEKFYFAPGDSGFTPIDTAVGRLGLMICWDQWYPEAARLMALAGADVLLYPTAIGWDADDRADEQQRQLDAWRTVQRGHAIANSLPVIVANRIGSEGEGEDPEIQFWGRSFICGQQGEILTEAPADEDTVLTTTLDLERTETLRRIWPFLRDRRIDAYGDLSRRFRD